MSAPVIDALELELEQEELGCEFRSCDGPATHVLIPHHPCCTVNPWMICTPCIKKCRDQYEPICPAHGIECEQCGFTCFTAAQFVQFRKLAV